MTDKTAADGLEVVAHLRIARKWDGEPFAVACSADHENACPVVTLASAQAAVAAALVQGAVALQDACLSRDQRITELEAALKQAGEALNMGLRSIRQLVADDSDGAPALQGVRMRKQNAEKSMGATLTAINTTLGEKT